MSFEVFVWVVQILVILFCASGVVGMGFHVAELIYRIRISKIEYERTKSVRDANKTAAE